MLDKQGNPLTYSEARDEFLSTLNRNPKTEQVYRRAIDLFLEFEPTPLARLSERDYRILPRFIQWLRNKPIEYRLIPRTGYAPSSIRLYLHSVKKWFEWMAHNHYFPTQFDFRAALYNLSEALRDKHLRPSKAAPEPPKGMREVVTYYDALQPPQKIAENPAGLRRWQLMCMRNRALMRVMAETGGRVSEILSLRVEDFPPQAYRSEVWRVQIIIKGGEKHELKFDGSLPFIRAYIEGRGVIDGPLFVNHSKAFGDRPMSRYMVWHVVSNASAALGLSRIHPHDFRHWCATELVNRDVPLDVVQDHLGHQTVETTRRYYAHTQKERADDYFHRARLLAPE